MIDVSPVAARAYSDFTRRGIDSDVPHGLQIDHQAVVTDAQTCPVVSSSPDGDGHSALNAELDGRYHVGDVCALDDQAGPSIDQSVVDLPRGLVAWILLGNQSASHDRGQRLILLISDFYWHEPLLCTSRTANTGCLVGCWWTEKRWLLP